VRDWLPPEAPIAMPVQDLWAAPADLVGPAKPQASESDGWRIGMIGLTVAMVFFPARAAFDVLSIGEFTLLDAITWVLFVMLFAWVAFAFVMAATGFCLMLTGGSDTLDFDDDDDPAQAQTGRTAILMPIYNEAPEDVFARLEAIHASLEAHGGEAFDFFVLSDTRQPALLLAESLQFQALLARTGGRFFYRHRPENIGRKAGNIAEWVRRFGAAYESMVVLDADSLMEGESIRHLAAAMARNPAMGLIQTVPVIVNRTSLFARLQQFANRLYGPMLSEGLAWWSGSEGNYWGHNAIVRVRAFAEQAGLPRLPGRKPFGGEIMSHDFVEAALLRRAGWEVRMIPHLQGTYEECPPSLPDMIVRERRWCQGNLQHSIVIASRGLHWTSRLHLIRGVSSYLTAPLWLAFVIASTLQAMQRQGGEAWDSASVRILSWVFLIGLAALVAPKMMSLFLALARPSERAAWGNPWRLCASFLLEAILSALIAPVLMFAQVQAFLDVLIGRDSGWAAQSRDDHSLSWADATRAHKGHTLAGAALAVLAFFASPVTLLWLSPVIAGLLLAIPLSRLTANHDFGGWVKGKGLLSTPEERSPPPILARYLDNVAGGLIRAIDRAASPAGDVDCSSATQSLHAP
jgi:membrane glycosyltransferase